MHLKTANAKTKRATRIVNSCLGPKGIWAAPDRYPHQLWTRDAMLAALPYLVKHGEEGVVLSHIQNLAARQRRNGQIPILFLDETLPFLKDKVRRTRNSWKEKWKKDPSLRTVREFRLSFMLQRWLMGQLWNLTPGTRDSELMFLFGIVQYESITGVEISRMYEKEVFKALCYLEKNLMRDGLLIGCDWRDTMHVFLGDMALLSNNSILYGVYDMLGLPEKALALKTRLKQHFLHQDRDFPEGKWRDYSGGSRIDPLGLSLGILYGAIGPEDLSEESLRLHVESVDSPRGVTIKCKHNPLNEREAEMIERTDGVVVWPFVAYFKAMAPKKRGLNDLAQEQFDKVGSLTGFSEYYDPANGEPYGAKEQLWSAVMFLRAQEALAA